MCIRDRNKPFRFNKPLILIHGMKDDVVNYDMPKKIMEAINGKNIQIIYLKNSNHRLSKPSDLLIIKSSIDNIRSLI